MTTTKRISISEGAKAQGVTRQRMLALAKQGRIVDAQQDSEGRWSIPAKIAITAPPKRARKLSKIASS